jgi:hypothetical protein
MHAPITPRTREFRCGVVSARYRATVLQADRVDPLVTGRNFNCATGAVGIFADPTRLSAQANAAGVPTAPSHASETLKVRCDWPLGSPLVGSDASLRFHNLSLQLSYGFLRLAG